MEQINPFKPVPISPQNEQSIKLAVLFLDMVSYSRRIAENEVATLEFMSSCFDALRNLASRFRGVLVKTMGDGALLHFSNAESAIDFGIEWHRLINGLQIGEAEPFQFRVGVHLGDVTLRDSDVFGQTVNIASRLQEIAGPGECVVSEDAYVSLTEAERIKVVSIGAPPLKNIKERIQAYRVINPWQPQSARAGSFAGLTLVGHVTAGIETTPQRQVTRGILAYLALNAGGYETIDCLRAIFGGAEVVNNALQTLAASDLPYEVDVYLDTDLVHLTADVSDTDLGEMLGRLRQNQMPTRLLLQAEWPKQVLVGLDGISSLFDSWLKITRDRWKWLLLREMERLIERTEPTDDQRENAAQAMLLQEPGNEIAALAKIECRLAHGDQSGAVDEYNRLKIFLSTHYGMSPNDRIRRLIRARQSREPVLARASGSSGSRRLLKLLVRPFGGATAQLAGEVATFRDELISNLARFRDWSVLDGGSETHSVDRSGDLPDYIVEGHPAVSDVSNSITLILTDGSTGRTIWSDRFEITVETWQQLQQEVIRAIAAQLENYISCDRLAATVGSVGWRSTTVDGWLQGDRALMEWTPEGTEKAEAVFRGILKTDPDHAPTLFRIASISNIQHVIWPGRPRTTEQTAEADALAARAVALDPLDARVQRTVAWTAAMQGAFARAEMHMDLAAKLNPASPATLASCAMGFAWFGARDKAKTTLTKCAVLSPYLPTWGWAYHASTNFFLDRLDDALIAAELGGQSIPDNQAWRAAILARQGKAADAGAAFRMFEARTSAHWAGELPASPARIAAWFAGAFPLKEKTDRDKLAAAIESARAAAY